MKLIDFASQIGVSPTTVSQAMHGTGRVSLRTRSYVREMAQKLGYDPTPHTQQVVTGQSHIVAMYHTDQDIFSDLFLVELAHSVQLELQKLGYGLLLDTAGDVDNANMPLNRWVTSRAVDGAIIIKGWADYGPWLNRLKSTGVPIVTFGAPVDAADPFVSCFWPDDQQAYAQLVTRLYELGHRRFGYIGIVPEDDTVRVLRSNLACYGLTLPDESIVHSAMTIDDGVKAADYLLNYTHKPTAIICRKDDSAIGAMLTAQNMGLRVPHDVSIIGHDNIPTSQLLIPSLTTIDMDFARLGAYCVSVLMQQIEHPDEQPELTVMQAQLLLRGSHGVAPKRDTGHSIHRSDLSDQAKPSDQFRRIAAASQSATLVS